ncbi:hypothetical protein AFK24_15260 [Pseudomonas syringae]|uniref:Uncharacterized protein n=1 Tax=Pseudomonas syringae TaxID=317 RepID=A0A1C7Z2G1_PSESX|nr:hypothetical protein [Pseudomonas syringae]OCR24121.1 hypothetical protein AFK24_15260 [Pseudomonas syringae]
MAFSEARRRAQQARDDYRNARVKQLIESGPQEVLLPPGLPVGAIIDPADGTLNKDVLTADLAISMAAWSNLPPEGQSSDVEVQWARTDGSGLPDDSWYEVVDSREVSGPTPVFPLLLKVPSNKLAPDGKYYLRLAMYPYNSGPTLFSDPVPLICDSEGPYRHETPAAMILPNPPEITDAYLAANDDKVIGGIPQYADYQPGDRVAFYWGALPPPEKPEDVVPIDVIDVDGVTWPYPVEFTGDTIRAAGDGPCYALYVLVDKATNASKLSGYAPLRVALGPLPSGLQLPKVPLADDGLVSLKDAIAGVDVVIESFVDYKSSDTIDVTWGTTVLPGVPVGGGSFPMAVRVPSDVLKNTFGAGTGPTATAVSYVVTRGGLASEIKAITVQVDFSVIGPDPDPDPWPDPVNDKLPLAEVYGEVSATLNELTRADEGKDATLKLKLYDPLAAGQVISFYWKGGEVPEAEYTVLATDAPGNEISKTVPWSYIEQAFNHPELPVHYRIRANADAENEQHSRDTLVKANAVTLKAPAAAYEGIAGGNFLNCESLYADPTNPVDDPAIRVKVPDLTQPPFGLAAGAIISMKWRVVRGYSGEDPISEVDFDENITLGTDYPATGFTWRIEPYADYILPIYNPNDGRGRVTYSFILNSETVTSTQIEAFVAMHTGVGPCPISPPPRKV